jgi:NAD(P)-dependent dehydrogenase (short-subunit alcohol dehydrogenase family)
MLDQEYGRIVNIGSLGSLVGSMLVPAVSYSAAKTGFIGLTRDLAAQWARRGVTVNAIAPGWFDTELTEPFISTPEFKSYIDGHCPMGRVGRIDELDGALLHPAT